MIKIIAKGAEFDVSAAVRNELLELVKTRDERLKIFYIVPDQFEFETEKAVYSDFSRENILVKLGSVSVLTFSSLSQKILENAGAARVYADDTVKNIVMHKAVREQKNLLNSLGVQAGRSGFCKKMVNTVSALKTAGITSEALNDGLSDELVKDNFDLKNCGPVVEKLRDVGKIFASYENYLGSRKDAQDAVLDAAEIVLKGSEITINSFIFVDCFNDFTGSQLVMLMNLSARTNGMVMGFAADMDDEIRENVFYNTRLQIEKISSFAKENDIEIKFLNDKIPFRISENSPIFSLTKNIFTMEKSNALTRGKCDIIRASDVYEELDLVCAKIKKLCCEEGFFYREIAVLCADNSYQKHAISAFEKYEIPIFSDVPKSILYLPAVHLFTALLNVLRDFSVDNVLSYLKTGFLCKTGKNGQKVALSKKDIDVFEEYVYEWDLRTKHLKKPFEFAKNNDAAEEVRKAVVEPVMRLRANLKNKNGAEITKLIYDFAVEEIGIERALYSRCLKRNSGEFDTELLRVNQQLWDSLSEIFDTLYNELSGENISIDEYARLFSEICSETALAKPPQYLDCVLVGDIDRTRAVGIKHVFIVGASYENFPAMTSGTGIFSENETEILRENLMKMSAFSGKNFDLKSKREQYCLSLYRAYRAVSLGTESFTLCFSDRDEKGASAQRSQIVNELFNIFSDIKISRVSDFSYEYFCRSIKSAKQRCSELYNENSREKNIIKKALFELSESDFLDKLDEIFNANFNIKNDELFSHNLDASTAQRLFRKRFGATSAEKLNLCKFNFFCNFGLGIREKNRRIFNVGNRGNAVHYVLQKILQKYCDNMKAFFSLNRADFVTLARTYLDEFCKDETNGDFAEDKRTEFLFSNLSNAAADVLITLQAEFAARDYKPKFFELSIASGDEVVFSENDESFSGELPEASLYSEKINENNNENLNEKNEISTKKTAGKIFAKPLKITLSDGLEIFIDGRIDRVDMFFSRDEKGKKVSYLRVVDYKFNAKNFDANNAKNGINIQMLLYLFALCDANSGEENEIRPGGICYIPSANTGAVEDKMSAFRLLAMNHHQNGLYVRDEKTDAEARKYADFLIEKICGEDNFSLDEKTKNEFLKAFIPDGENAPNADEFKVLREECLGYLRKNFDELFGGNVEALPMKYTEKNIGIDGKMKSKEKTACDFCRFSDICKNGGEKFLEPQCAKGAEENE